MAEVIRAVRKSSVLAPSSLACLSDMPTVNLTSGCAHGCVYCYTRGYSTYPGENTVRVYVNTFDKLCDEFSRKRKPVETVYFSPSSDLFQPVPEVLDMAYRILEFLFRKEVTVAILTKGKIPEPHLQLMADNARFVRARIGLTTLDGELCRTFEPHAPSPDVRVKQAAVLADAGIPTSIRMDPVLPGLTDDAKTITDVCAASCSAGVREIAISVLFLRRAVTESLKRNIRDAGTFRKLLRNYRHPQRLKIHAEKSSVAALPREHRHDIYSRAKGIASRFGIRVRICACKNPDLESEPCGITAEMPPEKTDAKQMELFGTLGNPNQ